jgi:hypothetical protein
MLLFAASVAWTGTRRVWWALWMLVVTMPFIGMHAFAPTRRHFRILVHPLSSSTPRLNVDALSTSSLPPLPEGAHRLIMMRHGESEFNKVTIFTGWCDVALTRRGEVEAIEAGEVFQSLEMTFRKCYTSVLTRSIVTAHRSLEAAGVSYTPLVYDWRLNERYVYIFQLGLLCA